MRTIAIDEDENKRVEGARADSSYGHRVHIPERYKSHEWTSMHSKYGNLQRLTKVARARRIPAIL